MRRTLRILASFALVALLSPAWVWLDARCTREIYRAAEGLGLITAGNSFWGQIHGHNIPLTPDWVRWTMFGVAGGAAALPFISLGILIALGWRTFTPPPAVSRWVRVGVVLALLLVWSAGVSRWVQDRATSAVISIGEAAGCEGLRISGNVFRSASGPFDRGPGYQLFNAADRWAPTVTHTPGAYTLALAAYMGLALKRRWTDDQPRCAGCGYPLEGLEHHTCPECGSPVRAPGQPEQSQS